MAKELKLSVVSGDGSPTEHSFSQEIVKIGRLATAHLRLEDPKVFRIHAVIEAADDGESYAIIDMGSTEGTFVNGERVSKRRLSDGDEIRVGDTTIRVGDALAAAVPAPPATVASAVAAAPVAAQAMPAPPAAAPVTGAAQAVPAAPAVPAAATAVPVVGWQAPAPTAPPPSNLAHRDTPETERALEIKTFWGTTVLDTLTVTTEPVVSMGDERLISGWGPFQKVVRCDIEVPSSHLPEKRFPFAVAQGGEGTDYVINIPEHCGGQLLRSDGQVLPVETLGAPGEQAGARAYALQAEEVLTLAYPGNIRFEARYINRSRFVPPPMSETMDYRWLNVLVLAFFIHAVAVLSFLATPRTETDLAEDMFRNNSRLAQFLLRPAEQRKSSGANLLKELGRGKKRGKAIAKAKGKQGKAGSKTYKGKKQGRMAIRGKPSEKELAKSTLAKLFGGPGGGARSQLFGTGGLGGTGMESALGNLTGSRVGAASGAGGLGLRGGGPGGGGFSNNSIGLGGLATHGVGGGQAGYGKGVGGIGRKAERDIQISAGSPIVMGSLDKEVIRRVIQQHSAQIRFCYERQLQRHPGLHGKVNTRFTISATGRVSQAKVVNSSLGNRAAESCITSKIRTWRFPEPKGGGVVIVNYPFILKTSG